jgi:AGZA family xanthine/uracil permease-like MFS transporter
MLDSFFKISQRGSTVGREIRGGVVTFFTMAYIVALNPLIIGLAKDADGKYIGGGDAPNLALVAAATALIAGVMTILMGVVANFPLAIATGLGLNTFVAVGIASKMSWADAMGLVVLEGIIILILVLTGFRIAVFKAVPSQLKIAISVGIGLFVRRTGTGPVPVTLGDNGNLVGWPVVVFAFGLFLMIGLTVKKVKGALLIGIVTSTILAIVVESAFKIGPLFNGATGAVNPKGWNLNVPAMPEAIAATPKFDIIGDFNILGGFDRISLVAALLLVFTLLLADFFDTMGTMTAIGNQAGLVDRNGNVEGAERILLVDSIAAAAGGAGSVSSNTSYIESASGVGEGAKTGLASVVTGVLFLLTTFLAPLVAVIPYEAATPALIIVGFLMMSQIKGIDWDDIGIAIPAFLTIILMPFTYNISVGIGAGFVSFVVIRLFQGRTKEIHPLMWIVSGLFMVYFLQSPINIWTA